MTAYCGIDLGGTKCLGVVLDGGEIVAETLAPTPEGSDAVVATIVGVARALEARAPLEAVGVGAAGLVDRRGTLHAAPNLSVDGSLPLQSLLGDALGLPVVVENDATSAAWAERQKGAARGFDDVVLVTLGTGIGGGIVIGGRVHRGASGFAGEIGHMVVDPHGPWCPCGQRGCWERFASGSALGRLAREAGTEVPGRMVELAGGKVEAVRGEHVTSALAEGDAQAEEVMGRFARWVGLGLASLANVFDPQVFVLGGGVVRAGDGLLVPVRAALLEHLFASDRRPGVAVVTAQLGVHAGAVGAALLAAGAGA